MPGPTWPRSRRSATPASRCTRGASTRPWSRSPTCPSGQEPWYGTPHWYSARPYAWAIAAEVAIVAGLPDAADRLAAAAPAGEENYWAAACLARAAGRLNGDHGALARSLAGWEGIDARFERACTLLLMDGRADEGRAELATLGCQPPATTST